MIVHKKIYFIPNSQHFYIIKYHFCMFKKEFVKAKYFCKKVHDFSKAFDCLYIRNRFGICCLQPKETEKSKVGNMYPVMWVVWKV